MLRIGSLNVRSCVPQVRASSCSRLITSGHAVDDDQQAAKAWLANYRDKNNIQRSCTISFSRSGGPGGQNVNKTSTKATLKLALGDVNPVLPSLILDQLANSRYASDKGRSLVIQSDNSRKQSDNKAECFTKLDELIMASCSAVIKKEADLAQLKKIQKLQAASNQRRLAAKQYQSAKKSARRQ